jgi:cytochrome c2
MGKPAGDQKTQDRLSRLSLKIIGDIINLVSVVLVLVLVSLGIGLYNSNREIQETQDQKLTGGWCGTSGYPARRTRSIHDTTGIVEYPNIELGKLLFRNNCATCHAKNMKDDITGPALGGVLERWEAYPIEDLYSYIRNSEAMLKSGHPRAEALWAEWQPTIMNSFEELTDEDIEAILFYIEGVNGTGYLW